MWERARERGGQRAGGGRLVVARLLPATIAGLLLTLGDRVVLLARAGDGHRLVALLGDGLRDVLQLGHVHRLGLHHLVLVGGVLRLVLSLVHVHNRRLDLPTHNRENCQNST